MVHSTDNSFSSTIKIYIYVNASATAVNVLPMKYETMHCKEWKNTDLVVHCVSITATSGVL